MNLIIDRARAYVYGGDWVADCPRKCGNVEYLFDLSIPSNPSSPRTVKRLGFYCSYCKHVADIDWPNNMEDITAVLEKRPIPHNRNWYPADHETAVKFRVEHGQTIADLIEENMKHGVV